MLTENILHHAIRGKANDWKMVLHYEHQDNKDSSILS